MNDELLKLWDIWNGEIAKCDDVVIPRSILPIEKIDEKELTCEIVGFSDGSSVAYSCVLYLRWMNKDGLIVDVKFIGAKAKVAAIKGNTTPRNELCGVVILARLAWSAVEALKKRKYPHIQE